MAVEIPVVIDIDKAFDEAAKRVNTASKPFVQAVDNVTKKLTLKIGVEDDGFGNMKAVYKSVEQLLGGLKEIKSNSGKVFYTMAHSTQDWAAALEDAKTRLGDLTQLQARGVSVDTAKMNALREAITLLTASIAQREREARLIEREAQNQLAVRYAIDDGNYALLQESNTITEISNKISALRKKLENIGLKNNQAEWTATGKAIIAATEELAKFEKKYAMVTTKPGSINRITAEMKALEAQWNSMSRRQKFDANGNLTTSAQKVIDKYRNLTVESEKFGKTLAESAKSAKKETDALSGSLGNANSKLDMLVKNGIRLLTLRYMSRFLQNVRNVTAEFEMQRISLASIIRDTSKANTLFSQIKEAALESPFEIKDLLKFTKQLAAYRIETDKLFDTTKRLADISAGLGVDMQRLILAYGQVRAAAVLRGQELRQFTEAGIPLVELLADKFTELKGRMVSASEVFELISKRAVPFSMIAEIFEDMTNAGGVFYEMQLKQSETLKGQWMKLKDAASIMYDEIGNTSFVNEGMKKTLQILLSLTRNWRSLASTVTSVVAAYGLFKAAKFFTLDLAKSTNLLTKSKELLDKATVAEKMHLQSGASSYAKAAKRLSELALKYEQAALSGNRMLQMSAQMQIGFAKFGQVIKTSLIAAVAALILKFITATSEAKRLQETIEATRAQGATDWDVAQRNFKRLADEAVNAADGSQKQRDALKELKQTYQDIIPEQDLEIERLRELKGNYDALTEAIRQNIEKQIHEQNVRNISTTYGETIGTETRALEEGLKKHFKFSAEEARRFVRIIKRELENGLLADIDFNKTFKGFGIAGSLAKKWGEAFRTILAENGLPSLTDEQLRDFFGWNAFFQSPHFQEFATAVKNQFHDINEEVSYFNKQAPDVGMFERFLAQIRDKIQNGLKIDAKKGTYKYSQEVTRLSLMAIKGGLEAALLDSGLDFKKFFLESDVFNFEALIEEINKQAHGTRLGAMLKRFVETIRGEYNKIIPPDPLVGIIRRKFEEIAAATGASMDDMQRFFKTGEQEMYAYVKELGESLEAEKKTLTKYQFENEERPGTHSEEEIIRQTNLINGLTEAYEWLGRFQKSADKKANKSALSFLKEDLKNVQEIYKRYKEFLEYMDKESAQKKIREIYGNVTAIDFLDPDSYKTRLTSILNQIKALMGQVRKYSTVVTKDMFNDIKASIKKNEGFASKAYKLPGEKGYTIGYGFYDTLPDGRKVTEDMEITMEEADSLLEKHIKRYSALVDAALAKYGKGIVLTEKQYNVLVDLAYQGPKVMEDAIKTAEGDINKLAEVLKTAASLKVAPELKDAVQMRDMRRYAAFMASMVTDSEEAQEAIVQAFTEAYRIVQDVDFTTLKDNLDRELKRISSEIKRSEAARDFYKNIFDATGDQELATSMTVGVYGNLGEDLNDQIKEQLMTTFVVDLDLLPSDKSIEDLQAAMDALDWSKLASYMPYVKKAYQNAAKEILESGTKTSVKQMETLTKELAKVKSYADKRVEIATKTAQRLREIDEFAPQSQKEKLREQALEKQAKDIAKLEYEAFKDTPLYTEMFENLDAVSSQTLQRMHDELVRLKGAWKDLDPTQLKEIQSRLDAIDKVAATRNPFGTLAKGFKELIKAGFGKSSQLDKDAADAAERVTRARVAQAAALEAYTKAQDEYNKIVAKSGSTSPEAKAAEQRLNAARMTLDTQTRNLKVAEELAKKAEQEKAAYADILRSISNGVAGLLEFNEHVQDAGEGVLSIMEAFGSSAESIEMISTMLGGLNDTISGISSTAAGFSQLLSGNIISGASNIAKGIGGLFKGITNIFYAGRVKRANKEIKEQEKILISLQEAYKDLDRAIAQSFGNEYIYNYNQQLKNLQAQAAAYQKQAAAERSKGKKKDKSKIESYEQSYRDTLNKIKDMQYQMAEYFAGTDITSAAEAFADAWLKAYKEFGNTTDAIKEKMQDMVESIVKRAALAGVVQAVLKPWYDELAQIEQWDPGTVAAMINKAYELVPTITAGLGSEAAALQAAGVNLRDTVGDFKGISRDIAGASEESILALAAGINTQNFYMSYMPIINENVAAIRAALTGEAVGAQAPSLVQSNNDLVLQYMSVLPNMDANIAELLAIARKVVEPRGTNSSSHVVAVRM